MCRLYHPCLPKYDLYKADQVEGDGITAEVLFVSAGSLDSIQGVRSSAS